jgi:hypothetical protein
MKITTGADRLGVTDAGLKTRLQALDAVRGYVFETKAHARTLFATNHVGDREGRPDARGGGEQSGQKAEIAFFQA